MESVGGVSRRSSSGASHRSSGDVSRRSRKKRELPLLLLHQAEALPRELLCELLKLEHHAFSRRRRKRVVTNTRKCIERTMPFLDEGEIGVVTHTCYALRPRPSVPGCAGAERRRGSSHGLAMGIPSRGASFRESCSASCSN